MDECQCTRIRTSDVCSIYLLFDYDNWLNIWRRVHESSFDLAVRLNSSFITPVLMNWSFTAQFLKNTLLLSFCTWAEMWVFVLSWDTSFNLYRLGITFDDTPTLKNLLNLLRAQLPGNYLCKCLNWPTRRAQVTNTRFKFLFGDLGRWSSTAAAMNFILETCLAETWSSRDRCGVGHIRIFTLHGYQTRSFVDPQKQGPNLLRCAFCARKIDDEKKLEVVEEPNGLKKILF